MKGGRDDCFEVSPRSSVSSPSANRQSRARATSLLVTPLPSRVHLPHVDLPLTQRNAQLVIAREYGYASWQDLTAEVSKRFGQGLEWAAVQARRVIHDNDVERLKQLFCRCDSSSTGAST
jgi:hypothetical protein